MCVWMPTVHQSALTVAAFYSMSDICKCLDCLKMALLPVNEKLLGCKSPYDWPVILSTDLVVHISVALVDPTGSETYILTCA